MLALQKEEESEKFINLEERLLLKSWPEKAQQRLRHSTASPLNPWL